MTESEYERFILEQRWLAKRHLASLILSWRVQVWPRMADDPIERESQLRRERAEIYAAQRAGLSTLTPRQLIGTVL